MRRNLWLTIGFVSAAAAAAGIAAWRAWAGTYLRFRTMFGRTRVYQVEGDDGEPVRLLEVGGIVQSGTRVDDRFAELVFEYLKRYDLMFEADRPIRRVCVLGCGGYDYPEHLIAHHPETSVDAVEIDPAITAIARQHFFLDRLIEEYETEATGRLRLICADALEHLESGSIGGDDPYDAIVNDTFDAGTPPTHLTTERFMRAAHDRLAPGGLFMTNIVSPAEGPGSEFLQSQVQALGRVFAHVYVFPCSPDELTAEDNVIVVATDCALPPACATSSL